MPRLHEPFPQDTETLKSESSENLLPNTKTLRSEISRKLFPKTETLKSESSENLLPNTTTLRKTLNPGAGQGHRSLTLTVRKGPGVRPGCKWRHECVSDAKPSAPWIAWPVAGA